ALIALAEGTTPGAVEAALPAADEIEVIQWIENGQPRQVTGRDSSADLVIVACSAKSASALSLIKNESALDPDRPVVVLQLVPAQSNGFMQDVFAAGADDIIDLPQSPERVPRPLQQRAATNRRHEVTRG